MKSALKNWKEAGICELSFSNTENGGVPTMNFDQTWLDENGAIHVNFDDGSMNAGGGEGGGGVVGGGEGGEGGLTS